MIYSSVIKGERFDVVNCEKTASFPVMGMPSLSNVVEPQVSFIRVLHFKMHFISEAPPTRGGILVCLIANGHFL